MFFFLLVVVVSTVVASFHLLGEKVGLGQEKNGDGDASNEKKEVLHLSLPIVHGFINGSGSESNIDKCSDKVGRLATITRSTIVEWALVCSRITSLADISPRSTGAISASIASDPFTFIVSTAPSTIIGIEACSRKHPRIPVNGPLHEDKDNHVYEEGACKCNHWNEFADKVQLFPKVDVVDSPETCSCKHLEDSENDRELHLEGVEEEKLI
mmetsp:Transcript_13824/g.22652  ORF Transcript_13824/g.22652 Transcript_13824/m.22652 type:complete len:212 (-) Transcript_13824:1681-2316(-)